MLPVDPGFKPVGIDLLNQSDLCICRCNLLRGVSALYPDLHSYFELGWPVLLRGYVLSPDP